MVVAIGSYQQYWMRVSVQYMEKCSDILCLQFCLQLKGFVMCSYVVFTVGDPFPNLTGGLTEYLFWCADCDQILTTFEPKQRKQ